MQVIHRAKDSQVNPEDSPVILKESLGQHEQSYFAIFREASTVPFTLASKLPGR